MMLYDVCCRRRNYVESDVDIDVSLTTVPQNLYNRIFGKSDCSSQVKVVCCLLLASEKRNCFDVELHL